MKVKEPFLSIAIPIFNRAVCIYATVNNLLAYDSDEIEVVVCDNCSTDNTQ